MKIGLVSPPNFTFLSFVILVFSLLEHAVRKWKFLVLPEVPRVLLEISSHLSLFRFSPIHPPRFSCSIGLTQLAAFYAGIILVL